jgi:hypothetical protein
MLHQLRQAMPDAERFLYADNRTLRWRPDAPLNLDVAEFERALGRAAALNAEMMARLDESVAAVYHADTNGTITFTSDG